MNINTKSKIIEILSEYGFYVTETTNLGEKYEEVAFLYNKEKNRGIVINEYKDIEKLQNLKEDVFGIRQQLKILNYNVWNIYYFITIKDIKRIDRQIYSLERDSKDLRKYVILNKSDIFRVPFITSAEIERNIDFLDLNKENLSTNDIEVDEMISLILKNNGEYNKLTNKVIEEIVNKSILGGLTSET